MFPNPSLALFAVGVIAVRDDGSTDCILPSFLICIYRLPPSGTEIRV